MYHFRVYKKVVALSLASLVPALATLLIVGSNNRGIWVNSNCMMPIARFLKLIKLIQMLECANIHAAAYTQTNAHVRRQYRCQTCLLFYLFPMRCQLT